MNKVDSPDRSILRKTPVFMFLPRTRDEYMLIHRHSPGFPCEQPHSFVEKGRGEPADADDMLITSN